MPSRLSFSIAGTNAEVQAPMSAAKTSIASPTVVLGFESAMSDWKGKTFAGGF